MVLTQPGNTMPTQSHAHNKPRPANGTFSYDVTRLKSARYVCVRLGNPDLDFEIQNRTQNPKMYFTSEKCVLKVDFNKEIQIRISWISFLPFDWEIPKRICKTTLVNGGLLFANYACAYKKPLFLRTVFHFPIEQ